MPKLKENTLNTFENRQKYAGKILVSKIMQKSYLYDVDSLEASITMHISQKTYYNRIAKPGKITLEELLRLGTKLHFTAEDYIEILGCKSSEKSAKYI